MLEPFLDLQFYNDPDWLKHLMFYSVFYFFAIVGFVQVIEKIFLKLLELSKRYKELKEAIEKAWDNILMRELKRMDVLKEGAEKKVIERHQEADNLSLFIEELKTDARPNDIAKRFKDTAQNRGSGN